MREKRQFSQRTSAGITRSFQRKIILAFEGYRSEPIYFKALKQHLIQKNPSFLIDMRVFDRTSANSGNSHPQEVLDYLLEILAFSQKVPTRDELFQFLVHQIDNPQIGLKEITAMLSEQMESMNSEGLTEDFDKILMALADCEDISDQDLQRIQDLLLVYDPLSDHVYLITDRDRQSFKEDQYDQVTEKCSANQIRFCPTNPCFEFWLLLHLRPVRAEEKELCLMNRKVKTANSKRPKKTYVEAQLNEALKSFTNNAFKKENYPTGIFMGRIDKALENVAGLANTPEELKNQIGSALPILFNDLSVKAKL